MNIEEVVLVMARQYGFNPEIKCDLQKKVQTIPEFVFYLMLKELKWRSALVEIANTLEQLWCKILQNFMNHPHPHHPEKYLRTPLGSTQP